MRDEQPKEKRLHEGGVGPEMRSPAGLSQKHSTLEAAHYFTARIRANGHNVDDMRRQSLYIEALETRPVTSLHFGHYLDKPRQCRQCGARWMDYEEKMTDVNIAAEMLSDAFDDRFVGDTDAQRLLNAVIAAVEQGADQVDSYMVAYTADTMQIGCQTHPINRWWSFDDAQITAMDDDALEWWRVWKPILQQIIAASPAEPTAQQQPQSEAA